MCKPFLRIAILSSWLSSNPGVCVVRSAQPPQASGSAEDLSGKPINPLKASAGMPVVLLFVRTDCPVANRYAPKITKLSEEFRGRVRFWLIYPDAAEQPSRIRAHLREYHYDIQALRDVKHELVDSARATITPEAAVFDGTGKLAYHGRIDNWYQDFGRSRPVATTHELEDAIRAVLDSRPPTSDHANAVGCYIADVK
jgi:hypothetical protein